MFIEAIEESLDKAKAAREELRHKPGFIVGNMKSSDKGFHLSNYANCLLDRQLDIFDDSIFLLENNRVPAACTISRGMIETYAFAKCLSKKVEKILSTKSGEESVEDSLRLVVDFTNSSRIKESEQEKIAKGVYNPKDYVFTEETKHRFENMLAGSEHVMNALRDLYRDEINQTKEKESQMEITYDSLSEWVHPSQTSIFHNYVPDTHYIPTSVGMVHLYDAARMSCARALYFIVDSENLYSWTLELADEITRRGAEYE